PRQTTRTRCRGSRSCSEAKMSCSYNRCLHRFGKSGPSGLLLSPEPGGIVMKRISLLNLLVRDKDAAIAFYTHKLGFVVMDDVHFGPKRWVILRLPDDDVLSIALNLAESEGDLALVGQQAGSQPLFALATDDCLRDYRLMKDAGVTFHGEPQVQPYG